IEIWGTDGLSAIPTQEMGDTRPDAHLLNGPSLNGVSQDDVDALLANLNSAAPPQAAAPPPAAAAPPPAPKAPAAPAPAPAPAAAKPKPAAPAAAPNGAAVNGAAFNQNEVDALFD